MDTRNLLKIFKSYFIITIGVFLYCFSWVAFIIPKGISGGGVTGISLVIYYATNGAIPVSLSYFVINLVLIVGGTIILGKGFGFKTIYSILCATFMFDFLPGFDWITNLSDIEEPFFNSVIGGTISAFGISAIFMQGGSTGGTDIIAIVLAKYRETSPGRIFMYCDLIIIGSVIFLPGKGLQDVVYGYMQMVSFSYMLDVILTGSKQSVQILIFSKKYKEVGDMLVHQLNRGVTALNSVGWYSQEDSKVLIVVARKQQLSEITSAVKEVDNKAFITVSSAMSVYGQGFEQVKGVAKKKDNRLSLRKFVEGDGVQNN